MQGKLNPLHKCVAPSVYHQITTTLVPIDSVHCTPNMCAN